MDNEKYSLRQRQKRKHILGRSNECQGYASDNSTESFQNLNLSKSPSSQGGKAKTKAAPLSKYRRKTANARERTRMREINSAFELLRHCVPTCITNEDAANTNEKLTKITTLRMAMKYIGILSDALVNPHEADYDFLYDCTQSKPTDRSFMYDNEDIEVEEVQCEKPEKTKAAKGSKASATKGTKGAASRKSATTKKSHKKQKPEQFEAMVASPIPSLCQASPASNASSAYASLSSSDSSASPHSNSSYLFENNSNNLSNSLSQTRPHNSMSDLSNLMLESDGESLNLSERCLSPLHAHHKPYSTTTHLYDCSPGDIPTLENPLELSLRLMDPVVTESLRLSPVPAVPPPSCFSPLLSLEPFNAFDLFHSDFNEQAALDLFLT